MSASDFDSKKATPSELRIQLEVIKERLIHKENEMLQLKKDLEIAHLEINRQVSELRKSIDEVNELRMQLEVTKQKLEHKEESLSVKVLRTNKQRSSSKLQALSTSLLFLLATLLASFGTNMLTSTPPDAKGYILVIIACIAYALAAFTNIFILGEEVDQ